MTTRQATDPPRPAGRDAQRRRTRRAIVEAARTLLDRGETAPTVDAVAQVAEVSRRTVYLHFPSIDQLMLDAALGALSQAYVDAAIAPGGASDDPLERVDALVTALHDLSPTTLPLGRQIVRLTADRPGTQRGARRVAWIEEALAPLAGRLTDEQHDRLVSALAVAVGFESSLVLQDVRGLEPDAELAVTRWTTRVLVDAMLAEADPAGDPLRPPGRSSGAARSSGG